MMQLNALIQGLRLRHICGPSDTTVVDITDDSRQVTPGSLFIARGGSAETHKYISQAIDQGAVALIRQAGEAGSMPDNVACYQHDVVDQRLAGTLAERFFNYPARHLSLIGVTGTNGKTTTTLLIQHLLRSVGIQTGVIGTIFTDDGTPNGKRTSKLTTPGAIEFSRELARMRDAGCKAVAAEVSSHALEQGRAHALSFRAAVFTNLTQDHLDYHKTMQAYARAKSILFTQLAKDGVAVINRDDPHAQDVLAEYTGDVLWTSLADRTLPTNNICNACDIELRAEGSTVRFVGPWGDVTATIPLVGRHNVSNTLQAVAAAHVVADLSHTLQTALTCLPQVPGRFERVTPPTDSFDRIPTVLVDYAHTPDALENALSALRPLTRGKLIILFGCGGDRDKTKRPLMAKAVCRYADRIYLTSDNPRTEDPNAIIKDALSGIAEDRKSDMVVQPDRAKAIRACIMESVPGDTVLLAGKGHEDYQTIGRANIHFDDREQARESLVQWLNHKAATA